MGQIPTFNRTILPDRSTGGASVEMARQPGTQRAQAWQQGQQLTAQATDLKLRKEAMQAQADNATWVNAQSVSYRKRLYDRMDEMRKSRESSPQNFHKDFDKALEEEAGLFLSSAPTETARTALQETLADMRVQFYDDNQQWVEQRNVSIFGERMEDAAENMKIMAYRRGQSGQALEDSGLDGDIEASVVTGASLVAPEKLGNIRQSLQRGVVANYFEGLADTDPAKAKALLASKKYDDRLGAEGIKAAEAQIAKSEEKIMAKTRVTVRDEMDDIEGAAKLGLSVPPEKIQGVIAQADAAGMTREADGLRQYAAIQTKVEDFGRQPLTRQQEILKETGRAVEGGDLSRVNEYAALEAVLSNKAKALESDPYGYYAEAGIVPEPAPMDFMDPQAMRAELSDRRAAAQIVSDFDAVTIPLFTKPEIAQVKTLLSSGDPKASGAVMTMLGSTLKPQEMQALARVMATESKTLAAVLANGDPLVSERILAGAALKGEANSNEFRALVNDQLESAILSEQAFETAHDAVWAYYKQQAFAAGNTAKEIDEDLLTRSIADVVGPVVELDRPGILSGSSRVLSYRDLDTGAWVDGDQLNAIFETLDDDTLKAMGKAPPVGPNGLEWDAATLMEQARIVSAGDGLYAFIDEQGRYVADESGVPYKVDARQLQVQGKVRK